MLRLSRDLSVTLSCPKVISPTRTGFPYVSADFPLQRNGVQRFEDFAGCTATRVAVIDSLTAAQAVAH